MIKHRQISLADISLPNEAKTAIARVLTSNRLTYGPVTERFEKTFAQLTGVAHATFVNSGTSALHLVLMALKLTRSWRDGDEILVPAVTFIATSNAVLHANLKPVFVDIEPDYYCMDPDDIEKHITKKTRAILPVHLFGQAADMGRINQIAQKHHLAVVEDAAEALFTQYKGKPVGSLSDASIFSTYAAHTITTGVGGFACTQNQELNRLIRILSYHGRDEIYHTIDDDDTRSPVKLLSLIERRFHFPYVGYSYRLTEMEAAIGVAQLKHASFIIKERKRVDAQLRDVLTPLHQFIQLPDVRPETDPIFMLYPLMLTDPTMDRDLFLLHLEKHGIETRLFFPLLTQPVYKKLFGDVESQYPVARACVDRGCMIGCHPGLTDGDIAYVGNVFKKFFK